MATLDQPVPADADIGENIAAKAFDETKALTRSTGLAEVCPYRARRQALEDLLDQLETLLDLTDTNPNPRVDVAIVAHRHLEVELIIGRVGNRLARVEGAPRGAADMAAGAEGPRQGRREIAGRDGTVLKRGGVVVNLDQLGETALHEFKQRA